MPAFVLGEVEASKSREYPPGVCVIAWGSWETYTLVPAAAIALKIDPSTPVALEAYMAVINTIIGLTAWAGVHRVLQIKDGDTLCVSGAAGAVGSLVCQLARAAGARVVGVCGSRDKCDFVRSLGCEAAIDHSRSD